MALKHGATKVADEFSMARTGCCEMLALQSLCTDALLEDVINQFFFSFFTAFNAVVQKQHL